MEYTEIMRGEVRCCLERRFEGQYGVIARHEALRCGLRVHQIEHLLSTGEWDRLYSGVYRLAGAPAGPEQRLLAACMASGLGAVASHRSAVWLWGLLSQPPGRPSITVPQPGRARVPGVEVHRSGDLDQLRTVVHRGIPCTDPLRALVDLGAVAGAANLDQAVDAALATRLVTVDGLVAEVTRLHSRGRVGVRQLRATLHRRGFIGAPAPSVLESRTLRLLHRSGVRPISCEVEVEGGLFRFDILLAVGLAMEVDGFAYHSSPEAKARDARRRNRIRMGGTFVLEYSWVDIVREPERVSREVLAALVAHRSGTLPARREPYAIMGA